MLLYFLFTACRAADVLYPTYREVVMENASFPYNKLDSPFDLYHKTILVNLTAPFVVLTNVVEIQQMVSYIVNIGIIWADPRLKFDKEVLQVNSSLVPTSTIWIPTVDCYNCVDVHKMDTETESNEALISPEGEVIIYHKVRMDTLCETNIEAFPFDTQFCGLNFYGGLTGTDRLNLQVPDIVNPTILLGTPEWEITPDYSMTKQDWGLVSLRFQLKRRSAFYVMLLILPTMIVTSLCISALTLPLGFSKGDKYSLGITGLLGLTFLLGIIMQQVPKSQKMPVMGEWLLIEMFFCVFGIILDEPVRRLKKCLFKRNLLSDQTIDTAIFVILFGANLLTTILMFTILPKPKENFAF